jgi:peptidyl-Lys metalloendopeptidase
MWKPLLFTIALYCGVGCQILTQISFGTQNNSTVPELEIVFTNPSDKDLHFLSWNTPFSSFSSLSSLVLTRNGKRVLFEGPIAKYGEPQRGDYLTIPKKSSLVKIVNLEKSFNLGVVGQYVLHLELSLGDHTFDSSELPRAREQWKTLQVSSTTLEFFLQRAIPQSEVVGVGANYDGCTATQTKTIQSAFAGAGPAVSTALKALAGTGGGPQFPIWFGTGNINTVKNVVTAIQTTFTASRLNYKCNDPQCTDSVYAFVYPTDRNYVVYLCGAFWKSQLCGAFDSQCGTLIHETSHFSAVGSTQDYAYGSTSCKSLAKSNPARAVANADSYEYFC